MNIQIESNGVWLPVSKQDFLSMVQNGSIGPKTTVMIDGKTVLAEKIRGLTFPSLPVAPINAAAASPDMHIQGPPSIPPVGPRGPITETEICRSMERDGKYAPPNGSRPKRLAVTVGGAILLGILCWSLFLLSGERFSPEAQTEIREFCKKHKVDVKAENEKGQTLLWKVAGEESLNIIRYLVSEGADVNAKATNGWTVLHRAAETASLDVIEYLVQKGAKLNEPQISPGEEPGMTPFHSAAYFNENIDVIKYFVRKTKNINIKASPYGTPLLHAVRHNSNLEVVKYLISIGSEPHDVDKLLLEAARNENIEIIKYFVSKGGNIHARLDVFKDTALHNAARNKNRDITKYIVENGVDVNVTNHDGETPLHLAVSAKNTDIVAFLLSERADANIKATGRFRPGETPLHSVCWHDTPEIARLLIKAGANVNIKNDEGKTPIDRAKERDNYNIVQVLEPTSTVRKRSSTNSTSTIKTPPDKKTAEYLVKQGLDALKAGENERAARCFREAASVNNPAGQTWLGMCYQFGTGVRKDEVEAVRWYKRAAEQGWADGQYALGNCYGAGAGVPQDTRLFLVWIGKAASQGHQKAIETQKKFTKKVTEGSF